MAENQPPQKQTVPQPQTIPETPPTPIKPNKTPIIAMVIVTVLSLLFSGYLVYQNFQLKQQITPQPTTTPTVSPDQTANWKTYTNNKFGYSFRFPREWEHSPTPAGFLTDEQLSVLRDVNIDNPNLPSSSPGLAFSVRVNENHPLGDSKNCTDLQNCIDSTFSWLPEAQEKKTGPTTFLDNPATVITFTRTTDLYSQTWKHLFVIIGDNFYNLHLASESKDVEENFKIFDQILSTFEFVDETADWKTYTSEYFSLKYPNSWYEWSFGRGVDLDFYQINSITESESSSDNRSHISFDIQGIDYTDGKTIAEQKTSVENFKNEHPEDNYVISEGSVDGQTALIYERTTDNAPSYEKTIWFVRNNIKYIISWTVHSENVQKRDLLIDQYKSDFDQILSTFKFTE